MGLAHPPMKKVIIILAVLGILIFAGILIFKRAGGPSKASLLVPADAAVFVNIPNVPMTGFRWQKTALARIAAEPELVAFLKKPTARFTESQAGGETVELVTALKPGNIFLCLNEQSLGLLGFQFWGKRVDYDNVVNRLRASLPGVVKELPTETYRGIEIVGTGHGDLELWSSAVGRWGLLGTDLPMLKGAIDRATKVEGLSPSLGASEEFLKVSSMLPPEPDMFVYLRPDTALNALSLMQKQKQPIAEHIGALKGVQALGAAWKMDGENQRDALFVLRPRDLESLPKLGHEAMALTDENTDFFFDFALHFDALPEFLGRFSRTFPDGVQRLSPVVELVSKSFGPECSVIGEWAAGKMAPTAFIALQVRDKEGASAFPAFLASTVPGAVSEEAGGAMITTIPGGQGAFTLLQTDKFLLAGMNRARLLQVSDGLGENKSLSELPKFEAAIKSYRGANEMFGFIDTRVVFENVYNTLAPVLRLSAMMVPSMAEVVDTEKMPAAATIGKHLSPLVVSQKVTGEGTLLESSGPVSLVQFVLIGGTATRAMNQSLFGN